MSVTPSEIIQYLYCPRFTFFELVLGIPQSEEKYYKAMKGRHLHETKTRINKNYLRQKLGVTAKYQEQYLTNNLLRGKVDEVLELTDGTMAPLDYKFAEYKDKVYNTYKTQLACYAWLIEHNFGKPVRKGYLVYTRSNNKVIEVPISHEEVAEVKKAATAIISIITNNFFPKATTYKKRCLDCTYRNICIK
ncbi:MAG: CRISPR-associated protein Cas4 [Candidatus Cyclonatronum sp.]|uniref:CRISPR-associated protein Cas4 n=1 Tax=Cyclonatronum sp. TaxID=3024185 RepID=UPI0025C14C44|nr:CRISPR-associated protein Cas4 [Cyclonatronum sp.]MCH8487667.1 CRISPR-associated protein Cas4 [Cyclonatronum sp.]